MERKIHPPRPAPRRRGDEVVQMSRKRADRSREQDLVDWWRRMRRVARRRKDAEQTVRHSEQRIDELWRRMLDDS